MHCRNPIRAHQVAVGPIPGEAYHEDCWKAAQAGVTISAEVSGVQLQLDYEHRIATEGLAGLLSPYAEVFPGQRELVVAPIAQLVDEMAAAADATAGPVTSADADTLADADADADAEELAATS